MLRFINMILKRVKEDMDQRLLILSEPRSHTQKMKDIGPHFSEKNT